MKYLLDTCLLSELIKKRPNKNVIKWMNSVKNDDIHISVLTLGEIKKGIVKLSDRQKTDKIRTWFDTEVLKKFKNRILDIDQAVAIKWGEIDAVSERSGNKIPVIDGLIASTALSYNISVVTRNTKDFINSGCKTYNPWDE